MATYAISDLHGQYGIFEKLLEVIDFSDDDYMYVLGDAIDRGPDGIRILQRIMSSPNMDLLIGNHEFLMLNSVDPDGSIDSVPGNDADLWLNYNGGDPTFSQYKELSEDARKDLLKWLNSRLLTTLIEVNGKTFCLTHSNFVEEYIGKKYEDCNYRVVWNIVWKTPYREDIFIPVEKYLETDYNFIIIGHVPVQRVAGLDQKLQAFHEQNILLIDGGCSYRQDGVLADNEYGVICIRLEDMYETVVTFASLY
jgi:serine/threonine protein phosphatase 1